MLTSVPTADGAIGGTTQKVGGPLDKEGAIDQHFNADEKIGGMVQENLADKKQRITQHDAMTAFRTELNAEKGLHIIMNSYTVG